MDSIIPDNVIPGLKENVKIEEGNIIIKDSTNQDAKQDTNQDAIQDIANIQNPINILQQEKSKITTNPFIPNEQKIREFEIIDKEANEIIKKAHDKNNIYNVSISEINSRISKSTIGFFNDLFLKPEKENWIEYLQLILLKEERYTYLGFVLISFVIFMKFIE
jgi:hypothetical protein